ncbi:MAG: glycoside hydrolase family 38 C-terminal domain-containing protein, partial [Anaerolineae bacterium]
LPATGYRVYRLSMGSTHPNTGKLTATGTTLESPRFRLTFDQDTGYLVSLYDKAAETEVLAGPAARPVVVDDPSDTWSHDVFRFDQEIGAFRATRIQVVAQGPVKAVLRVESIWGSSALVQDFTLTLDLDRIDVHVTVDWHEQHKLLKLRFPVAVHGYKVTHEIPYGHIERLPNGEEYPIQRWVDISGFARTGAPYGLSVLNDGKPSVDVIRNDIGLTVLRSPVYAHHDPVKLDPDTHYTTMDQGVQTFTYSLYPHLGSWEAAGTVRRAGELNQPPVALVATGRPAGTLPLSASYASADPPTVMVTVLKQAEDGDDLVVRALETAGAATHATIALPAWSRTLEADFRPGEIKTWRVPAEGEAMEVNLLEE